MNDAVHVERSESQQLEGVVAFLGSVQFAEGDDWVGVRLTGASVGLGKNDGSVKGVSYFSCGPNGGVFVRRAHVTRRELTRLEELRLKRELAKQGKTTTSPQRTTSAAPRARTPTRTPTTASSRSPPAAEKAKSSIKKPESASVSSKKSRLDELRERRAALAEKSSATTSSQAPSRAESVSSEVGKDELDSLQQQVEELTRKLQSKEEENVSLQQSLSKAERQAQEAIKAREEQAQREVASEQDGQDMELQKLQDEIRDTEERLEDALGELEVRKRELDRERKERAADVEQLTRVRSELSALQHEWQAMSEQTSSRNASDASHYKERAKLQAELGAAKRKADEFEKEKVELESALEELTLDKEQLQEEKEALQDRLEELKIDAETAQMEVEELKMEIEDVKQAAEGSATAAPTGGDGTGADADDVAQALSVQNARLREALIRLREQASVEKMDLSRQLRAYEKDAAAGAALSEEVETLRTAKEKLDEEIRELKEVVDQGSAFESMVESLSDRVLMLEDDNLAMQSTIREMEEAADITAEMEEVQADENKTLLRDLEIRDSIIRNLEEAIKMQRRREEDFQRTVGNYRKTVETLKQEKKALLDLQEGGEGEKGNLLATSQKALARAAQLVADAANARKREAEAVFDRIEAVVQRHLSERLESLLPQPVASAEVASVKGELLLSRVVGKASRSLEGMAATFTESVRSGMSKVSSDMEDETMADENPSFQVSDESAQCIANMICQSDFAVSTIDVSADLLKLLCAGQWPDLLPPDASTELGAVVGHSIADLDVALGNQLKLLKEEGVLSPHTSNIGAFQQSVQTTMQSLRTTLEADASISLALNWAPPGWQLFKDVSIAKFSCLSAGAVVASIVSPVDDTFSATSASPTSSGLTSSIKPLMTKLDQISTEATKASHRMIRLDLQQESTVSEMAELAVAWKDSSLGLSNITQEVFSVKRDFTLEDIKKCETAADDAMRLLAQFSSALRAANLNSDDAVYHPLSPESKDSWEGISSLARAVRSVDGDADDVNYLLRARALERQLEDAVENGPKLSAADAKVASLEKVRMVDCAASLWPSLF